MTKAVLKGQVNWCMWHSKIQTKHEWMAMSLTNNPKLRIFFLSLYTQNGWPFPGSGHGGWWWWRLWSRLFDHFQCSHLGWHKSCPPFSMILLSWRAVSKSWYSLWKFKERTYWWSKEVERKDPSRWPLPWEGGIQAGEARYGNLKPMHCQFQLTNAQTVSIFV